MNEGHKRILRRVETVTLIVCVAVLVCVLYRNATANKGAHIPTTIVLTSNASGIPSFHGILLENRFVRRSLFRVFSALDYDVEVTVPKGWMRNPMIKSNVWSVSLDVEKFGLSPGDRAIRQQQAKE